MDILLNLCDKNMTEILFKKSGSWKKIKKICSGEELNSIGYFQRNQRRSGTGFIIKVLKGPDPCALILTAVHIFFEDFKYVSKALPFIINNETYIASPLRKTLNWDKEEKFLIDPISNNRISVPSDWCVCELLRIHGTVYTAKLTPLLFCQNFNSIQEGDRCQVLGYPREFCQKDLHYVAPAAQPDEFDEVVNCVDTRDGLVKSSGHIKKIGKLYSITCPTANGMSGSPVLRTNGLGNKEVIGIIHGGPAGFIHKHTALIMHEFHDRSKIVLLLEEFQNWLANFKTELKKKGLRCLTDVSIINLSLKKFIKKCKRGDALNARDFDLIDDWYGNCLSIEVAMGATLDYNLCVPIRRIYNRLMTVLSKYN